MQRFAARRLAAVLASLCLAVLLPPAALALDRPTGDSYAALPAVVSLAGETVAVQQAPAALPETPGEMPPASQYTLTLARGCTEQLAVSVISARQGRMASVSYQTDAPAVCRVDETGLVTAVAPGSAVITVSVMGVDGQPAAATCAVTVPDDGLPAPAVQPVDGICLLPFGFDQILSIGNQAPGQCSLYAMRYARTVADGEVCSGKGMWQNGALWWKGGFSDWSSDRAGCLQKLYDELNAGRPVIVHLQNTYVEGVKKHSNRLTTHEYHANAAGGWTVVDYPHVSTSARYGHWVCIVGYAEDTDPAALTESDFFALDPARVSADGTLAVTRLLDDTLWVENSPLKVLGAG